MEGRPGRVNSMLAMSCMILTWSMHGNTVIEKKQSNFNHVKNCNFWAWHLNLHQLSSPEVTVGKQNGLLNNEVGNVPNFITTGIIAGCSYPIFQQDLLEFVLVLEN